MGAGKTTVGELIAQKINRKFIDVDAEIEKEYNMPVSQIFSQIGEKAFREKEKDFITKISRNKSLVISLGGGAFLQDEIRKICLSSCIVLFLDISWENWKERISLLIDSRPVLQGKSAGEIKQLFDDRQEIYSHHHLKVQTDNRDACEVAECIIHLLKQPVIKDEEKNEW
ncbi:shikimate kinase [Bacillus sp. T33-2]|uniref:shikimate kinase n=1 Tax=Bacillus sp. T33-2 TaxID=2054168 RepID=UPI0021550365|nr:shikimate kinase [Bacillus sp. T33-2]